MLASLRYACLRIELKDSPETRAESDPAQEAPMRFRIVLRGCGETAENLGGNVAVGLFLS